VVFHETDLKIKTSLLLFSDISASIFLISIRGAIIFISQLVNYQIRKMISHIDK